MSASMDLLEMLSHGIRLLLVVAADVALVVVGVTSIRRADATAGTCVGAGAMVNLLSTCIGYGTPLLLARFESIDRDLHTYRRWMAMQGLLMGVLYLVMVVLLVTALARLAGVATKALRDAKPQAF